MTKRTMNIGIEGYEGTIVVRRMKNFERLAMLELIGIDQNKMMMLANKKTELNASDVGLDFKNLGKIMGSCGELIESVSLKNEEHEFSSWEDLEYAPEGMAIQIQVMNQLMGVQKN